MENLAKKQVNTKVSFDISLFNKCIDVIKKLYTTGAENTETDTQRAYICQATKNTIIVKENKKAGKQIATFPKKECFEYLGSKLVDTTKNKVDTTPSQRDTTNTKLDTTKINVDTTPSQEKKNEIYKSSLTPLNQHQVTPANLTKIDVSNFAIDLHKAGFCAVSNILPPAYQKIETQTESQVKEIFSKPNAKELHLLLTKNLFCIDVDLKVFETSQDKDNFFNKFKDFLISFGIDFYEKLVIESTKSKGLHYYFYAPDLQVKNSVDKNLAYYKTKPLIEFLKVKVTCFPTANYEFIQGDLFNIPALTNSEFSKLVDTCKEFCDKPKEAPVPAPNKRIYENNNNTDIILDSEIFEFCINVIDKKHSFAQGNTNDYLTNLIHYCNIKGLSKDYVLFECQNRFLTNKVKSKDIASKVNSIYNNYTHEHNKEPYNKPFEKSKQVHEPNKKSPKNSVKSAKNQSQEDKPEKNAICVRIEKTIKHLNNLNLSIDKYSKKYFLDTTEIDKSKINSILLDCKKLFNVSKEDFFTIIESQEIKQIDKIEILKNKCENTTNCKGTIKALFDTLILEMPEHKALYYSIFEKWFIGIWQSLTGKGQTAKNDLFLIFTGNNNLGKSFFVKNIFESVNLDCAVLDKNNENNENDLKRFATSNACIIFDDLKKDLFKKDDFFKSMLSNANIDIVPKYSNTPEQRKKIASFVGTSNYKNIIFESEFNRRIVPISIIDRNKQAFDKLDKLKVFAEAYHLFCNGETHELTSNEIEFVKNVLSKEHKEVSFESDFIFDYIMPAKETEPNAIFLKASEINEALPENLRKLNITQLGILLNKAGFKRVTNKIVKGKRFASCYCVVLTKKD